MPATRSALPEPALAPVFDAFYRAVQTALAQAGLQSTKDPAIEADPTKVPGSPNTPDCALSAHCGALTALVESSSHTFSGTNREGKVVNHAPEDLLDAQLVLHEAALKFLAENGGRARWAPGRLPVSPKGKKQ